MKQQTQVQLVTSMTRQDTVQGDSKAVQIIHSKKAPRTPKTCSMRS